eukprot:GILJ01003022.1.p1 GENE.GILJ01003022.1~~GILJ01003022.1.p1  ORF type:complete len:245 (-),score=21.23 GILJ01003022.1:248-982(-)
MFANRLSLPSSHQTEHFFTPITRRLSKDSKDTAQSSTSPVSSSTSVSSIPSAISMSSEAPGVLRRRASGIEKNYQKWRDTPSMGSPLFGILPMKSPSPLEEDGHTPILLAEQYSSVGLIVDLSRDNDPYSLIGTSMEYFKLMTTPSVFPEESIVHMFVDLLDAYFSTHPDNLIAVHCHYGFNRTGFFVCSYLVLRKGIPVDKAIDMFAEARPPGIRHEHFKTELRKRYGMYHTESRAPEAPTNS